MRRPGHPRTTIASAIYSALRDDIVSMRRKPGEPIQDTEITQVYGVSRTPVREVLLRLSDEGLIDVFPQSGTFVSLIPVAELPEAILIHRALEEAAAVAARVKAAGVGEAVIKHSQPGCDVIVETHSTFVPSERVKTVVDTTAAGDSFSAGYLAGRLLGRSPVEAARVGHRLAATVIQHRGAIIPREATASIVP